MPSTPEGPSHAAHARPDPTVLQRIQGAQAEADGECVIEVAGSEAGREIWRQTRGGVTAFALAAYGAFRVRLLKAQSVAVGSRRVVDHLGATTLVTAVDTDKLVLLLSGLTWGYRGTGPSGLAAVLTDLAAFAAMDAAADWVARLPIDQPWRLDVPRGTASYQEGDT